MQTFAQKSKAPQQSMSAKPSTPVRGHFGENWNVEVIRTLQRTIGNQAVQRMLHTSSTKSNAGLTDTLSPPLVHCKLSISRPDDEFEKEADQVSEQIMRMPDCSPLPNCPSVEGNPQFHKQQDNSQGQPLPEKVRSFFEPRFCHDLGDVRMHTDTEAAEMAESVNARAFAKGNNIVFGAGQYNPDTGDGRRLIAHELTHVIQQSREGSSSVIYRSCGGPPPRFDLNTSRVGGLITTGLNNITVTVPNQPPGGTLTQPRIDPSTILRLLSNSSCFLHDAAEAERLYFTAPRRQRRSPPLTFNFHENPERGSDFRRRESQIAVEVTTMAEVVQRIVHETAHAIHSAPSSVGTGGAITRRERGGVTEESNTRTRENEIMEQISANPLWQQHTGQTGFPRSGATAANVRDSFISGLPKLTYQEFFIIEAMRNDNRVDGVEEERTRSLSRSLIGEGNVSEPIRGANARHADYSITLQRINQSRGLLNEQPPSGAPSAQVATRCIEVYNRYRRNLSNPATRQALNNISPLCFPFIDRYQRLLNTPFDPNSDNGRDQVFAMIRDMTQYYENRMSARRAADALVSWYDDLPANVKNNVSLRNKAFNFFSWILIAEKMSREWQEYAVPNIELRNHHLDFLSRRIGAPLAGIQRP